MQERNAQPADVEIPSSQQRRGDSRNSIFPGVSKDARGLPLSGTQCLLDFPWIDGLVLGPLHLLGVMVMRRGDGWIGGVVVAGAEKVGPIGSLV
jgi:hypothetical protein